MNDRKVVLLAIMVALAMCAAGPLPGEASVTCPTSAPAEAKPINREVERIPLDQLMKVTQEMAGESDALIGKLRCLTRQQYDDVFPSARRQFIVPMLGALKELITNGVPDLDARPILPPTAPVLIPTPEMGEEAVRRARECEQINAKYREGIKMEQLWGWRKVLTHNIVAWYSQPDSSDPEELRAIASNVLGNARVADKLAEMARQEAAKNRALQKAP